MTTHKCIIKLVLALCLTSTFRASTVLSLSLAGRVARVVRAGIPKRVRRRDFPAEGVLVCDNHYETLSPDDPTTITLHRTPMANHTDHQSLHPYHAHTPPRLTGEEHSKTIKDDIKTELVEFSASNTKTTDSFRHDSNKVALQDFFKHPETCECLFSTDARLEPIDCPSHELVNLFRSSPLRPPLPPDCSEAPTQYYAVTNPPMGFVGLQLYSVAYVAVQILNRGSNSYQTDKKTRTSVSEITIAMPEIQLTLLTSCFQPQGPKFLVWLFDKVLGTQSSRRRTSSHHDILPISRLTTTGFTSVTVEAHDTESMIFRTTAQLQGSINIPPSLWQMLPLSRAQLETRGSQTIQAAMDEDIELALERLQDAYQKSCWG